MGFHEKKANRFTIPFGVMFGVAAGFVGGLLLAPNTGRRSRKLVMDKVTKVSHDLRGVAGDAGGKVVYLSNRMRGTAHEIKDALGMTTEQTPTDNQMVQRVRADLGHDPNVPLGQLSIDARDGVVYLQGQIDSRETADYVASRVAGVDGVKGVVNELHPAVN